MTTKLLNNRYQVIQVLGSGGFGETFLAEDVHMPSRRRCVIKQLKPVTKDPKTYQMIQQRFEREAATLEFLGEGSEQIPKLYAYFSEQGQFYLVQEWIQGQTLTDVVNTKGALSETEVRAILLSLLSVLDYVHSKGIIHRDIKPENIILRSLNSKPVLIDFGAVKETIRSVATTSGNLTQSIIIGTPGYMSSEQAIGRPVYATDIYSLGVTAIYLLTGKRPYDLETHPQTGNIVWRQYAPGISSNLAEVIDRATKQNAGDRYTTASKMLYALQSATAPPTITPQSVTGQVTIPLSAGATASAQNTQLHPNNTKNPTISSPNWQKPAWIAGSLVVGSLIGAVAIANINRQPEPEDSVATSPVTRQAPEANITTPTPTPTNVTPPTESNRNMPRVVVPPPAPVAPNPVVNNPPEQPVETSTPSQSVENSVPQEQEEASTSQPASEQPSQAEQPAPQAENSQAPVVSAPQPEERSEAPASEQPVDANPPKEEKQEQDEKEEKQEQAAKQEEQKVATANTSGSNVPAFPVGTPEDSVRATLGEPRKRSRGLWNTRAYLYNLEPNRIDLGYLFDRRTGVLRQTEVAFAQSVEPEVMKNTLQGMLGGSASGEIKQGLQKVYERQSSRYSFNLGGLQGVIQRNKEDQIYIGVWDADLRK
ncbi:protein kinase [Scytonema sp. UIC 10036]|uniref:serine/threonine-protein kinase n=1 Tax=Scytonema sp. UIC 10036 TaxID=2304196 RepID=UPI0012DABE4D|nr:serine/threonine-protein kinase [Scytonema sp. UIC 10036]MUG91875.1 protein kinase [Scytonema sp. UIC 10036]